MWLFYLLYKFRIMQHLHNLEHKRNCDWWHHGEGSASWLRYSDWIHSYLHIWNTKEIVNDDTMVKVLLLGSDLQNLKPFPCRPCDTNPRKTRWNKTPASKLSSPVVEHSTTSPLTFRVFDHVLAPELGGGWCQSAEVDSHRRSCILTWRARFARREHHLIPWRALSEISRGQGLMSVYSTCESVLTWSSTLIELQRVYPDRTAAFNSWTLVLNPLRSNLSGISSKLSPMH